MTPKSFFPRMFLVSLALTFIVTPIMAADNPTNKKPFTDSVRVNVVNVEVWVTDRKGQPILDLAPKDFELFEDGKPVVLSNFYAASSNQPPVQNSAEKTAKVLQAQDAALKPPLAADDQAITMVIFIDNLNITRLDRRLVLDSLVPVLKNQMREGDRVMVASYFSSGRQKHEFTTQPSQALTTLDNMRLEGTEGWAATTDRSIAAANAAQTASIPNKYLSAWERVAEHDFEAQFYDLFYREKNLIDSLNNVVDSLATVSGHKILVFVSDGIPLDLSPEVNRQASDSYMADPNFLLFQQLQTVVDRANAGRVTFYAVNATKYRSEWGGNSPAGRTSTEFSDRRSIDSKVNSMLHLASKTGGRYFVSNPNLSRELGAMVEDLGSYYSLGFKPDHFGDGKLHALKIDLKRPNCTLRHREGYLDKTTEQRLADRATATLVVGSDSNPLGVQAKSHAPTKKDKNYILPISVFIPSENLTLLPGQSGLEGRVVICTQVSNEKGEKSPVAHSVFKVHPPKDKDDAQQYTYVFFDLKMEIRPGPHTVAVAVQDEIGQVSSSTSINVDIGKAQMP